MAVAYETSESLNAHISSVTSLRQSASVRSSVDGGGWCISKVKIRVGDHDLRDEEHLTVSLPAPKLDHDQGYGLRECVKAARKRPPAFSAIRTATCVFPGRRLRLRAQ